MVVQISPTLFEKNTNPCYTIEDAVKIITIILKKEGPHEIEEIRQKEISILAIEKLIVEDYL